MMKKPAKILGKTVAGVALASTLAIGGANLGTYFDYKYNNYDYNRLQNRTALVLGKDVQEDTALVRRALEAVKLKVVGAVPPESAGLVLQLRKEGDSTMLDARYIMVWSTNKGVAHRDEEEVRITWRFSEKADRFEPLTALTRYHHKWVEMPLAGLKEAPVIVIQNPAHTPGIPGTSLSYRDGSVALVDVFTVFSAEKWAGSSLATGLPNKFDAMPVSFTTRFVE